MMTMMKIQNILVQTGSTFDILDILGYESGQHFLRMSIDILQKEPSKRWIIMNDQSIFIQPYQTLELDNITLFSFSATEVINIAITYIIEE